jgi:hypothetical protein
LEAGRWLLYLRRYAEAETALTALSGELAGRSDLPAEQGEALHLLGELDIQRERFEAALGHFTRSIEARQRVPAGTPKRRRDLARGYGYRGDVFLALNRLSEADADYGDSLTNRQGVVDKPAEGEPALPEARFQLARGWTNFATFQTRIRAFRAAVHFLDEASKLQDMALKARPDDTEFLSDAAGNLTLRADLRMRSGALSADGRDAVESLLKAAREKYELLRDKTGDDAASRSGQLTVAALTARLHADDPAKAAVAAAEVVSLFPADEKTARPADVYHLAAAKALTGKADAVEWLTKAVVARHYRDRHWQDVRDDVAFRSVRDLPAFKEVVGKLEEE